ncbi:major facilitator superfamily domain-containing protein [Leptodontidium sp. MPI-SDFR-AT-0119]|nr:major facilitator superfamily domain-containing protein [Leptodontidium sp. MPI-SDFR-AT-0119]
MEETHSCGSSTNLDDCEDNDVFFDDPDQQKDGPLTWTCLLALTCTVGGLQVVWSVVLSNGTPFLVSLGLSKSFTALIWVAAPLSGIIVQPLVGVLSDTKFTAWGRRRPFMLIGAIGAVTSMLALAWVEDITDFLTVWLHLQDTNLDIKPLTITAATVLVYVLNISIQPVQMSMRALIIEQAPPAQQQRASAWASYMTGAGNIFGYTVGYLQVEKWFERPSLTHFQGLCVTASIVLSCAVFTTCFFVRERDSRSMALTKRSRVSTLRNMASVPRDLMYCYSNMPQNIRKICHIQFWAWMGWFPFLYYSTTYIKDLYMTSEAVVSTSQPAITADAIRAGTLANLSFAIVAFFTNISLSLFLLRPNKSTSESSFTAPFSGRSSSVLGPNISIIHLWTAAHIFFSLAMTSTFFIRSHTSGTILIGSIGLSWSLTLWAPFAIIGHEIRTEMNRPPTGTILSLSNVAISTPQIVAAVVCSAVFKIVDVFGGGDGTAWVLRLSACVMLRAGWLTWSFGRE